MMRKLQQTGLLWVLLLWAAGPIVAQNIIYQCDFEQPADRNAWVRNKFYDPAFAVDLYNRWYIGRPGNFGPNGDYGLYVSSYNPQQPDSSKADYQAPGACYTMAYCDMPTVSAGTSYTLQFDYRICGNASNAWFQVWWMPTNYPYLDCDNNNPPSVNEWVNAGGVQLGGTYSNQSIWKSFVHTFTPTAAQTSGRLIFLWANKKSNPNPPSACIDNIVLAEGSLCATAPTNLQYDKAQAKLSWTGSKTDSCEVTFYNTATQTFDSLTTVVGNQLSYTVSSEGHYTMYVRRLCPGGGASPWATTSTFVWIRGARCLDLFDLGVLNQNAGVCYVGEHKSMDHASLTFARGMEDKGYAEISSMHTIHYDPTETDPNSDGKLYTVPTGEVASVRVGAGTSSGQDARIEYKYTVTPGQSDLMYLTYACVLNSGGHDEENPFFQLDILDSRGQQIEGCTHEYFVADMTGSGGKWHQNGDTWWSDWDTVAVSLRNFPGQTLTIRLTSSRCIYDTHFGYAYFTINCASGDLEGITCGDFATDHFDAPDGFDYRWYWEGAPDVILSRDQRFDISKTTDSIYVVDVISKSSAGTPDECFFSLTANPNPRFPYARAGWSVKSHDCQNIVTFNDSSYVVYVNRKYRDSVIISETETPDVEYIFGDGSKTKLTGRELSHIYPAEGGHYDVKVVASMSNGVCQDTFLLSMDLPNLHTNIPVTIVDMCDGIPFKLPSGVWVHSDTVYVETRPNPFGCDVEYVTDVRYHDTFRDTTRAAICEHASYHFEGQTFSKEGLDSVKIATTTGCDSVRYLNLHVIPDVHFSMDSLAPFCDDLKSFVIPVTVDTGCYAGVAIIPEARAVLAGFRSRYEFPYDSVELKSPLEEVYEIPADTFIKPGYYTFELHSLYRNCRVDSVPFRFTLFYSEKTLYQKDGYIVLYNPEYNYNHYEFQSYRWYRDGELLPDTKSYIQPTDSDKSHYYQVELLPAGDSVMVMSCPFEYTGVFTPHATKAPVRSSVSPLVVQVGAPLYVAGEGDARIYDALGRLVQTAPINSETPVSIPAPGRGGMYVVRIQNDAYRVLVH